MSKVKELKESKYTKLAKQLLGKVREYLTLEKEAGRPFKTAWETFIVGVAVFIVWLEYVLLLPTVIVQLRTGAPRYSMDIFELVLYWFPVIQYILCIAGTLSLAAWVFNILRHFSSEVSGLVHKDKAAILATLEEIKEDWALNEEEDA